MQVSAENQSTCALGSTAAAYCWGYGFYGQLGNNSTASSIVPVAVTASGVLSGKTLTQTHGYSFTHMCALDSAGTAYCWGANNLKQLGNNSITDSSVAVLVLPQVSSSRPPTTQRRELAGTSQPRRRRSPAGRTHW